jgi:hypothetical protein
LIDKPEVSGTTSTRHRLIRVSDNGVMLEGAPAPVARLLEAANANDTEAFVDGGVGNATVIPAEVGGDGFNGPSHFTFVVGGDRVARMTIRA